MELEPGIRRFIATIAADAAVYPDPHSVPYPESRAFLETVRRRWTEGGPVMHRTRDFEVPGSDGPVPVRLHDPSPTPGKPVLVYLHGGGWTFFSVATHDRVMREYAGRSGVVVLGVDYARAPEAKFPIALHQVLDVLRWVRTQGALYDHGIDSARIAAGGDSAGANLAVAAALSLRDAGDPALLHGLVLNYGAWDTQYSDAARRFGGPGFMLGTDEMAAFWRNYARSDADYTNPLVCPLHAEVAGLPSVFMAIPQCDLLAEQNQMMAVKLQAADVPVRAVMYEGASHSFLEAVSISAVSGRAFDDAAAWLRRTLGAGLNATV